MPQISPLFWINLYIIFLLSLILVIAVQYFLVIYCNLGLTNENELGDENLWNW